MSRAKAAQHCTIKAWLSAKGDNKEGRFLQIGNSLFLNEKFKNLSLGAQKLYFCMALDAGNNKRFTFPHSRCKVYKISSRQFWEYVQELIDAGFIKKQSNANLRQPNDYEFCFSWKTD